MAEIDGFGDGKLSVKKAKGQKGEEKSRVSQKAAGPTMAMRTADKAKKSLRLSRDADEDGNCRYYDAVDGCRWLSITKKGD